MFCDIAVFDRTDHVDEPLTPPASEPEPCHDSPPPLVDDRDSDSDSEEPFDWLYALGDGFASKGRAAFKLIPRAKKLGYPFTEDFVVGRGKGGARAKARAKANQYRNTTGVTVV